MEIRSECELNQEKKKKNNLEADNRSKNVTPGL